MKIQIGGFEQKEGIAGITSALIVGVENGRSGRLLEKAGAERTDYSQETGADATCLIANCCFALSMICERTISPSPRGLTSIRSSARRSEKQN